MRRDDRKLEVVELRQEVFLLLVRPRWIDRRNVVVRLRRNGFQWTRRVFGRTGRASLKGRRLDYFDIRVGRKRYDVFGLDESAQPKQIALCRIEQRSWGRVNSRDGEIYLQRRRVRIDFARDRDELGAGLRESLLTDRQVRVEGHGESVFVEQALAISVGADRKRTGRFERFNPRRIRRHCGGG